MAYNKNYKSKKQDRPQMWSDVQGMMRLFGNPHKQRGKDPWYSYSASVGSKDENGEWSNLYFNVAFPKGQDPRQEGPFAIDIKNGFITFREYKGVKYPKVVVMDFDMVEGDELPL